MALSIEIPGGSIQLSANPIWVKVAGAVIPAGATEFKLLCKVTSVDGDLLGGPFIDGITPDSEGKALFDISGYVDQPMVPEFQYPPTGVTVAHAKSAWVIEVEFGQTYIDENDDRQTTYEASSETITVLKGGISDYAMGLYNDADTSFYEDWILGGKFLTNQPKTQIVSPSQVVKLWYMGKWEAAHDITLFTKVYTYPNKVGHIPMQQNVTIYPETGVLELNINPTFQGFELDPEQKLASFEFWIQDSGGEVSETFTFIVDNAYKKNNNYLFVANSKSGVDVIWLNGAVETSIETAGTEGYRPLGINVGSRNRTILTTSKSSRRKWKINTGYKSSDEMKGMVDVFISRNIWLLRDSEIIPVSLANGDKLLNDTMDNLHSIELELMEAHNTRFV
ncbi:MAG: hypothetical protein JZU49_00040 [Sulfuricurvum sp.]|nr:hypothetical protein [Sulfuricurvum sp.]